MINNFAFRRAHNTPVHQLKPPCVFSYCDIADSIKKRTNLSAKLCNVPPMDNESGIIFVVN